MEALQLVGALSRYLPELCKYSLAQRRGNTLKLQLSKMIEKDRTSAKKICTSEKYSHTCAKKSTPQRYELFRQKSVDDVGTMK